MSFERYVTFCGMLLLSCQPAAPPSSAEKCPCEEKTIEGPSKPAPVVDAPSNATESGASSTCRTTADCPEGGLCAASACKSGRCELMPTNSGGQCAPASGEQPAFYCYATECLPRRTCAKACIFDVTVRMKPHTDKIRAACPKQEDNPTAMEECVMQEIGPGSALGKRANREIHECMTACGYPPLMTERQIEDYEGN